jgi:hypothetical protein
MSIFVIINVEISLKFNKIEILLSISHNKMLIVKFLMQRNSQFFLARSSSLVHVPAAP